MARSYYLPVSAPQVAASPVRLNDGCGSLPLRARLRVRFPALAATCSEPRGKGTERACKRRNSPDRKGFLLLKLDKGDYHTRDRRQANVTLRKSLTSSSSPYAD